MRNLIKTLLSFYLTARCINIHLLRNVHISFLRDLPEHCVYILTKSGQNTLLYTACHSGAKFRAQYIYPDHWASNLEFFSSLCTQQILLLFGQDTTSERGRLMQVRTRKKPLSVTKPFRLHMADILE